MRKAFDSALASTNPTPAGAWHLVRSWNALAREPLGPVLVLVEATEIGDAQWIRYLRSVKNRVKSFLVFSAGVPSQGIPERLARLHVRDPRRIHLVQADTQDDWRILIERLLSALGAGEEAGERVLDAWWEGNCLVVISPEFKRLRVPLANLRPLQGHPKEQLEKFEIDEDGALIYWPELDVHLGWEQFAQATDPEACLKARQKSTEFNKRYGGAIRALRQESDLRQSDIKGLTARQVGRIERGLCRATHAALSKLAQAHRLSTSDYLAKVAERLS
jgi:hypothetical protein